MLRRTRIAASLATGILAVGAYAPPLLIDPAFGQISVAKTHKVEIQGFAFVPAAIVIKIGDSVEWTNRDFAPHTASAENQDWTTESLGYGQSGQFIATKPGVFSYFCAFHPHMKGEISVK